MSLTTKSFVLVREWFVWFRGSVFLGAQWRDILKLVVMQGMTLTLTGMVLGLIAAFSVTRIMSSVLYGVGASDPMAFTVCRCC